jgi:phospholipase C
MENKSYDEVIGSSNALFINNLLKTSALATNYFAVAHPSLPNYLALVGTDTFSITTDCTDCFVAKTNLVDSLESVGKTWKAYMEDLPSICTLGNSGLYDQNHNPFIYFDDIRNNPDRCAKIVSFDSFASDLSQNTLPNYSWISPNLCHNMHSCPVTDGDTWLANIVPQILNSDAFTKQNSLLVIVWDEAEGVEPNHVPLILVGPKVKTNYQSNIFYNHYSLVKTIESAWNLPTLTDNDKSAIPMSNFFILK